MRHFTDEGEAYYTPEDGGASVWDIGGESEAVVLNEDGTTLWS